MPTIKVKEGIEIYPEGLYFLRVSKIEVQTVKQGERAGDQFLTWESLILDASDGNYVNETYKHTTPLAISPRSKYFRLLEVLGVTVPEDGEEVAYDTDDFINKEFVASVDISKITQGKNIGRDKNEFKQLWTPVEFQQFQQKSVKLGNKAAGPPEQPSVNVSFSENQTPATVNSQPVGTAPPQEKESPAETVKAPISQRPNIINSTNLNDFPE